MSRLIPILLTLCFVGCVPEYLSWYTVCTPENNSWTCTKPARVMTLPAPPEGSIKCFRVKDMDWACTALDNGMTLLTPTSFLPRMVN
jgi:hypothetical protein